MLETERLILRRVDADRDFDAWAAAMADEDTVRYTVGKTMSRAEAWRSMASVLGHWQIRGYGFFSVECKQTGAWVGRVGPWFPEGWPEPEIGWTIAPTHLRRGYATEAGRACLRYAFEELGWKRTIHCILEGNVASIGVAEKLGSRLLRTQDGLPGITESKVLIYGQDAPE
ncbi:MAG: GNAT family N-acetyltransferase [Planctomycetes bacterium]|nr:GNAT family N-acetyltransferase [Planctomycetota bacterium]